MASGKVTMSSLTKAETPETGSIRKADADVATTPSDTTLNTGTTQMLKTDNPAHVGLHCFERAGLGKAPFKVVGFHEAKYQAHPDAPVQPGRCCEYCGQSIIYVVEIKGADGRTFGVGSDCMTRAGDAGLIKSYKARPEVRALNRAKAKALDDRKRAEWQALVSDPASRATLAARMTTDWKGQPIAWIDYAEGVWPRCGASGRAKWLKAAKAILAGKL